MEKFEKLYQTLPLFEGVDDEYMVLTREEVREMLLTMYKEAYLNGYHDGTMGYDAEITGV